MSVPDPLPLDELRLVSVPDILLPFCQELTSAEGTTRKDRVWLLKNRVYKLVTTYVGLHFVFKNRKVHIILIFDFSLLLRDYTQLEQGSQAALAEQHSAAHCTSHHCLVNFIPSLTLIFFIKGKMSDGLVLVVI